jgi:peptidoglycan/LPS O-acetylase OafA/YrhL
MLLVLLTHLSLPSTILSKISKQLVNPFYWGAELFLMLSGFLITQSIIHDQAPSIRTFTVKRTFRIYPPLIIYVCVAFGINLLVYNTITPSNNNTFIVLSPNDFLYNSVYLLSTVGYILNHDLGYHYGQMWSVIIEIQYYVFTAFISITLFGKFGGIVLQTIYISFLCLVVLLRISNGLHVFWLAGTFAQYLVSMNVDFIAAGGLLALWKSKKDYPNPQRSRHTPVYITVATERRA